MIFCHEHSEKKLKILNGYVLVVVLIIMFLGVSLIGLSTLLIFSSSQSNAKQEKTQLLRASLDSAIENTILILLRKPSYSGEEIIINQIPVQVDVASSSGSFSIQTVATFSGQMQTAKVELVRDRGELRIESWIFE